LWGFFGLAYSNSVLGNAKPHCFKKEESALLTPEDIKQVYPSEFFWVFWFIELARN